MANIKFKVKHIRNLLVRTFTIDNYYVCEDCRHIHKRDGKEIRLDEEKEGLLCHYLWYGSVHVDCYCKTIMEAIEILRINKKERIEI